jgi:pimeloyl-ACP methyl ester carboxylesterase
MWDEIASPDFDEFSLLKDYADYEGLPWDGQPIVERRSFEVAPGQQVRAVVWGEGDPELVFLHGGGQNAHTWDTVLLALKRPAICIDLPGHGHSDWRADRDYGPWSHAEAVAKVIEAWAPNARAVVGMSMGGLTTIRLLGLRPDLVRAAVIIDVSPGVMAQFTQMSDAEKGAVQLVAGPPTFDSFEQMLDAVAGASGRKPEDVWRGVRLNAKPLGDGRWGWRYDQMRGDDGTPMPEFQSLWDDVGGSTVPLMLMRGALSTHVHDDDVAEYRRRRPDIRAEVVEGAGHSVQSNRPLVLAALVEDFVFA